MGGTQYGVVCSGAREGLDEEILGVEYYGAHELAVVTKANELMKELAKFHRRKDTFNALGQRTAVGELHLKFMADGNAKLKGGTSVKVAAMENDGKRGCNSIKFCYDLLNSYAKEEYVFTGIKKVRREDRGEDGVITVIVEGEDHEMFDVIRIFNNTNLVQIIVDGEVLNVRVRRFWLLDWKALGLLHIETPSFRRGNNATRCLLFCMIIKRFPVSSDEDNDWTCVSLLGLMSISCNQNQLNLWKRGMNIDFNPNEDDEFLQIVDPVRILEKFNLPTNLSRSSWFNVDEGDTIEVYLNYCTQSTLKLWYFFPELICFLKWKRTDAKFRWGIKYLELWLDWIHKCERVTGSGLIRTFKKKEKMMIPFKEYMGGLTKGMIISVLQSDGIEGMREIGPVKLHIQETVGVPDSKSFGMIGKAGCIIIAKTAKKMWLPKMQEDFIQGEATNFSILGDIVPSVSNGVSSFSDFEVLWESIGDYCTIQQLDFDRYNQYYGSDETYRTIGKAFELSLIKSFRDVINFSFRAPRYVPCCLLLKEQFDKTGYEPTKLCNQNMEGAHGKTTRQMRSHGTNDKLQNDLLNSVRDSYIPLLELDKELSEKVSEKILERIKEFNEKTYEIISSYVDGTSERISKALLFCRTKNSYTVEKEIKEKIVNCLNVFITQNDLVYPVFKKADELDLSGLSDEIFTETSNLMSIDSVHFVEHRKSEVMKFMKVWIKKLNKLGEREISDIEEKRKRKLTEIDKAIHEENRARKTRMLTRSVEQSILNRTNENDVMNQ